MKNSKLNEIVGYPVVVEDIDIDALKQYLIDEGFKLQKTQNRGLDFYVVGSHPYYPYMEILPITQVSDYYDRLYDLVKFCGNYEKFKRRKGLA